MRTKFLIYFYIFRKINTLKKYHLPFADIDLAKQVFSQKVLPQQRRQLLKSEFSITDENAFVFVANDLDYIFIEIFSSSKFLDKNNSEERRLCILVLLNEYLNQINSNSEINNIEFKLKCKKIASYVELLKNKAISKRISLIFFSKLF